MVDLHIHSSHSDGIFDLKEIIEIAQKSNITYFSITDHDNIESSKEIKDNVIMRNKKHLFKPKYQKLAKLDGNVGKKFALSVK